jgi:hypothetical protein
MQQSNTRSGSYQQEVRERQAYQRPTDERQMKERPAFTWRPMKGWQPWALAAAAVIFVLVALMFI